MDDDETICRISENMSDDQIREIIAYRGGCSCHISPPCNACSAPLTIAEAKDLGWWPEVVSVLPING